MVLLENFNAAEYESSFEPIKPGRYVAMITGSDLKQAKNGSGKYIELEFTILSEPYRNRKIWDRLNLYHPNEAAVKFAKQRLAAICRAVGVLTPRDTSELHNIDLVITVKERQRPDGQTVSEIAAYEPLQQSGPATILSAALQTTAQQQEAIKKAQAVAAKVGPAVSPWRQNTLEF